MKKDVTIAIIVGFAIGAIAALAIVHLPSLLKKPNSQIAQLAQKTSVTPSPQISGPPLSLEISEPKNEEITSTSKTTIKGKTQPSNTVVLDSDIDNIVAAASADGSFSFPVTLSEGGNQFMITSYNDKAEAESKTITILYTTEKL
jgi:hypothetical protein